MKFKILKGTDLFQKLTDLKKKIDRHNKQATKVAKELGGIATASSGRYLAGGMEAIHFETPPDKALWRVVGNKYDNLFLPKVKNKEANKKIEAVPSLDNKELNDIVGFPKGAYSAPGGKIGWATRPGMEWHREYILMTTPEGLEYTPPADVIEILESEFEKLKK